MMEMFDWATQIILPFCGFIFISGIIAMIIANHQSAQVQDDELRLLIYHRITNRWMNVIAVVGVVWMFGWGVVMKI